MDSSNQSLIRSDNSEYSSKNTAGKMLTKSQVVAEIARLTAVFGPAKDRPAAILELMVDEWHNALKGYSFDILHQAITNIVSEKRYWPVLAEVKSCCQCIVSENEDRQRKFEDQVRASQEADAAARNAFTPYEDFCKRVMVFIKRDEHTFNAFRDAGVRALDGIEGVLAFDTERDAQTIEAMFGAELDEYMGRHITLRCAPIIPNGWVSPKWERTKVFTKH